MVITSVGGVALIGSRSHLTKIVDKNEIGKAMSFMSVLDTLAPSFSAAIFPYIFKYTIDTYPGLVYHITAFLIIFPICMMMWIDIFTAQPIAKQKCAKPDPSNGDPHNNESEMQMKNEKKEIGDSDYKNAIMNTEFFKKRNSVIDEFDNINISRLSLSKH